MPRNENLTNTTSSFLSKDLKGRFALRGYTLIELLVSIAIMAVLFSVGSANYRDYARRKEVDNAATLIKGDLRLTQEYALAGKIPDTTPDNACESPDYILNYYEFKRTPGLGGGYTISAHCSHSAVDPGADVIVKSVELSAGITIEQIANAIAPRDSLYFYPRGLGVGNLIINQTTARMTVRRDPYTKIIYITKDGKIQ